MREAPQKGIYLMSNISIMVADHKSNEDSIFEASDAKEAILHMLYALKEDSEARFSVWLSCENYSIIYPVLKAFNINKSINYIYYSVKM